MAKKPTLNEHPTHEGLKSMYLELENFKNIDKKIIDIGGHSIIIMGKNGTGKSTLIQAMKSPMDSKIIPSEPIKKGEETAKIIHRIAGNIKDEHGNPVYKEYEMTLFFTPGNKSGRLTITNEKGETVKSPATMIKTIIGNVSFDITGWMNDKKDKKLQTLKNLTGCGPAIDTCNMEIKRLKDERKIKNDRASELEGALKNHGFSPEEISKYSNPVNVILLNQEMASVADAQSGWDAINTQIEGFRNAIPVHQENITKAHNEMVRIDEEIKRLHALRETHVVAMVNERGKMETAQSNLEVGEEWKQTNIRPSITDVAAKIKEASDHNVNNQRIGTLGLQQQEMIKLKGEVEGYKAKIESEENKRNDLISKSQLPVAGLSFDDEEIYYENVPLEFGAQNSALIFDIGVDVAIALNPNLKIIFLDDASLFDKDHLTSIVKRIEERGYMAVCEIVAETNDVEVKFIESDL